MINLVPLYLNDILWKYAEVDAAAFEEVRAQCFPSVVTPAARKAEKSKMMGKDFTETVQFIRVVVPIAVGLNDVRYYGVHKCLRVNPNTAQPSLVYDIPSDPEDEFYTRHKDVK